MMQAPTEAREKYFEEVYGFNIFKTTNPLLGGGSLAREQSTRKQEAEQKSKAFDVELDYNSMDAEDILCGAENVLPS